MDALNAKLTKRQATYITYSERDDATNDDVHGATNGVQPTDVWSERRANPVDADVSRGPRGGGQTERVVQKQNVHKNVHGPRLGREGGVCSPIIGRGPPFIMLWLFNKLFFILIFTLICLLYVKKTSDASLIINWINSFLGPIALPDQQGSIVDMESPPYSPV